MIDDVQDLRLNLIDLAIDRETAVGNAVSMPPTRAASFPRRAMT